MLDPHTYDDREPYNDVVPNEDYLDEEYPYEDYPDRKWGSYIDDDDCEYVSSEEEEDDGLWWGRDSWNKTNINKYVKKLE